MRITAFFSCVLLYTVSCLGLLRADLNGDKKVDFRDLSILAAEWMCEEPMADSYLQFNGVNQYVTVANDEALNFGAGDFSISFWMKGVASPGSGLLAKMNDTGIPAIPVGWSLSVNLMGKLYFLVADSINIAAVDSNSIVANTDWIMVTIIADRLSNAIIYINGVLDSQIDISSVSGSIDSLTSLYSGAFYSEDASAFTGYISGSLDDIRIYKKALSQAEVTAIYNGGKGQKIPALNSGISWGSNCDDGSGNTLTGTTNWNGVGDPTEVVPGTLIGNDADSMWVLGGIPFNLSCAFDFEGWD